MSRSYEDSMMASGTINSVMFPYSDPFPRGDFWDNCESDVDRYLLNYMISEFCKKDIRFRIPTLDILAEELCLIGDRRNLQDLYKEQIITSFDEYEFTDEDESVLNKIPENILIAQCFLMSTPMYLLYDNRKDNRFDKELYVGDVYFIGKLSPAYFSGGANPVLDSFDIIARENLKGNLVGLRLFIDKARDKYEELSRSMDPKDFYWELCDRGNEKLSTGYRPGEKNRLGYFVPEPVISILKDKYLLGTSFDSDILPAQFDRNEMFNWVADIVFIDFVNEKTYGKKCKARVLLNSIEGVYPDFDSETDMPHLEEYELSYVKFTTESGKKITVDLFGLQEIHKISRIG